MKRSEFEHAIRAAGSILGTAELVVIGSQAIHATVTGDLPEEAQRSIEVDIVGLGLGDQLHVANNPSPAARYKHLAQFDVGLYLRQRVVRQREQRKKLRSRASERFDCHSLPRTNSRRPPRSDTRPLRDETVDR